MADSRIRRLVVCPPLLRQGDTIGIAAPSSAVRPEDLQPAIAYLRSRGFEVRTGPCLYERDRFLAGTDEDRASDLQALMADPDVRAVFAARGGYGSARLLDRVDLDALAAHPKLFVGFSDTTALQLGLLARIGLASVSGLALKVDIGPEGMDAGTEASLWNGVMAGRFGPEKVVPVLPGSGGASGVLLGGCLSLVTTLVGTPFEPDFTGSLLYLEDVGEAVYRVDRMLTHLRMAGVFDRTAGILFGQFEAGRDSVEDGPLEAAIEDLAGRVPCPVFKGLRYGHGRSRKVMPVGIRGIVEDGALKIEDWGNPL